jgi:type I restriction enzyme M protein
MEPESGAVRWGAERIDDDGEFRERLEELNEELEWMNAEVRVLEERIGENMGKILIEVW